MESLKALFWLLVILIFTGLYWKGLADKDAKAALRQKENNITLVVGR